MKDQPTNAFRNLIPLAIAAIMVALSLVSISKLELVEDISETLPQSGDLDNYSTLYNRSGISGSILVAFSTREDEMHIDAAEELADILEADTSGLIKRVRLSMADQGPSSLVEHFSKFYYYYARKADLDSLQSEEFVRRRLENTISRLSGIEGMAMKELLLKDPLQLIMHRVSDAGEIASSGQLNMKDGLLYTRDESFLLMIIDPTNPPSESETNSALVHEVQALTDSLASEFEIKETMVFGGPVIAVTNADRIRADIKVVAWLSVGFILLLLLIAFRNPFTPLLFLLPPVFGFVVGLGAYSLIIPRISALAVGVGTIMLGIAIDYSFHFFNHYRHNGSVSATLKEIRQPLLLGCLTTVLAFFGLRLVNSEILREFGMLAGFILVFSALFVLTFLPALIQLTGFKMKPTKSESSLRIPNWLQKAAVPTLALATIGLLFYADDAQFEDDLNALNYFPEHLQVAQDRISGPSDEELTYVLLKGEPTEALSRASTLNQALETAKENGLDVEWSNAAGLIHVPEFVLDQDWVLPDHVAEIGTELGLRSAAFANYLHEDAIDNDARLQDAFSMPILENLVLNDEKGFALVFPITGKKSDSETIKEVVASANESSFAMASMAKALIDMVSEDLNLILLITSILVFFTLLLNYGRIELALITFLPMVVSWIWILGFCGLFEIKFNMVNVVVTTFIFGLGDDYSIFISDGILSKHRQGIDKLKSYRGAILLSALTTIVGTGVLAFAGHPALKSIAILSVVGMISVVLAALILQPFLFKLFIENRTAKGKPPLTWLDLFITFRDFGWFFIGCIFLVFTLPIFYLFPAKGPTKRKWFNKMLSPLMQSVISMNTHVTQRWENEELAELDKPCVIIANHTSFIDILACSGYSHKILILTNEWVWNSPFFGWPIRYAEYIRAKNNGDLNMDMIRRKISEGYSVLVFPEGTRSYDGKIARFKKGAFKLAEDLDLDILPLVLHGFHRVLNKGDYVVNKSHLNGRFLPRIKPEDQTYGDGYSERGKMIGRYFRSEFEKDVNRLETPKFHNQWVRRCYTYKGPVLEWYVRIKLMLETNFEDIIRHVPRDAKVYDLGCGYGYLSMMLAFTSEHRTVLGVDYDQEKIEVAANNFYEGGNVSFQAGDLSTFEPETADVYIIKDVLHYMTIADQDSILERCANKLNVGGTIIIRDGIEDDEKGQKVTAWTERFSTRIFGFNKTKNDLYFLSEKRINDFADRYSLSMEMIRNDRSSNHIFILKK